MTDPTHARRLRGPEELVELFRAAEKPPSAFCVGLESEKFGVDARTGAALPFFGPTGVQSVLHELAATGRWSPKREHDGGEVLALRGPTASITLEPGAQLELSGAPHRTLQGTADELAAHAAELGRVSAARGIAWLAVGFHPFARQEDLPWVPKLRYPIMREYLPTRGSGGLDMMRRTATVQANLDYASEEDALRKLRLALRASPIVNAMFAHSPFVEGRPSPHLSHRTWVNLHVDPDRYGLVPPVWRDGAGYADYIAWALDVPMFLVTRGTRVLRNTGQTFRAFLRDGFGGERATAEDWEQHLNTLFPEVRLKRTIEIRGGDSHGDALALALGAVWKGLLYAPSVLSRAEALLAPLSYEEIERARHAVADGGLRTTLAGQPMGSWAAELLALARAGLVEQGGPGAAGPNETPYLAPIEELVAAGITPAEALRARVRQGEPFVADVVAATRVDPPTASAPPVSAP